MSTINFTTDAQQDAVIQRIVDGENSSRARQQPPLPPFTIPTYIINILTKAISQWKLQQDREDLNSIRSDWESATEAKRQQVRDLLKR